MTEQINLREVTPDKTDPMRLWCELVEARRVIGEIVTYLDPHPPAKPMPQEALDIAETYLMKGREHD